MARIREDFARRLRRLEACREDAEREIDRCRDALDSVDDEVDRLAAEEDLAGAERRLRDVRHWIDRVDEIYRQFHRDVARFDRTIQQTLPSATRFLQDKIQRLHEYRAVQVPRSDRAERSVAGTFTNAEPRAGAADSRYGGRENDAGVSKYALPRGFRWVPVSTIHAGELAGVGSESDFSKVDYSTMRRGCARLLTDVLPHLQTETDHPADDFRQRDEDAGVPYSDGLLRVYEAFFGSQDFIYLVPRRDNGQLDLINGRHRVKVLMDLGWDAVPAKVKE